jgi:hypothetical protein
MRSFTIKRNLLKLSFCLLLILEPVAAMPPQELCAEPYQPYAIICFVSFCLGALLCALIHKYCVHQPAITPFTINVDSQEQLLQQMQKNLNALHLQQDTIVTTLVEKKEETENLTTSNKMLTALLCLSITQTASAVEKNNKLLKKMAKSNHDIVNNIFLIPATCYWQNKYLQEKKAFAQYQQKEAASQIPLLITSESKIKEK